MFSGEFNHGLDDKGRYIVPARFRHELGDRFMITRGLDNCLFVYPLAAWEAAAASVLQAPSNTAAGRRLQRNFFSGAVEVEADKQYRIVIPASLRQYAALDKEIVTVGMNRRLEIWQAANWQNYLNGDAETYEAAAEQLEQIWL